MANIECEVWPPDREADDRIATLSTGERVDRDGAFTSPSADGAG
jgi:hypothetical protein